jgi:signal peptidase I
VATRDRRTSRHFRDLAIVVIAATLVALGLREFVVRSFYIPSESMSHTLEISDRIIVDELTPRFGGYARGDIVVFHDPANWLSPEGDQYLIKRVIGVPGDHVSCCGSKGRIEVNGEPIDEPYLRLPEGTTKASELPFDVTVPADSYWVMGDNRSASADSRYHRGDAHHGFVPRSTIVGRAVATVWPLPHWRWLG